MKQLFLILLFGCVQHSKASNYYFSSESGDDSRSFTEAQNPLTPWKTLAKLNAFFSSLNPGDSILLKRGEVYEGALLITKSGNDNQPIVFASYGNGAKPVISGLTVVNNWSAAGSNIWETTVASNEMINTVLMNGKPQPIGRYPNSDAVNKGYLTIGSTNGSSQITDPDLSSNPDWTGGEVVIRKARWVMDRNLITSHSGNTINYISESPNPSLPKYGYFIQNHPKTLDVPGEWYYNVNQKKLGLYLPSSPATVLLQASTINTLVSIYNQSNIVFRNLNFQGANISAFEIHNAQHINLQSCDISFSGVNALNINNADDIRIENSVIAYTNNIAINAEGNSNLAIRNNKIRNTGMIAGMGKGNSGAYEGIMLTGDHHTIELNKIENTGYNPITFRGNSNIIRNNFITDFCTVKDDGGGIYSWNNIPNAPPTFGTKISNNTVINGKGAGEGTDWKDYLSANGIYMDDNTANVEITGNTVAKNGLYGIYLHNAHEITISDNTVFNNKSQVVMVHDTYAAGSPIRNISMYNNIFFSKEVNQQVAQFITSDNDIKDFGTFDNNYYARPVNDNFSITTGYQVNGTNVNKALNLDEWKALSGKDLSSKKSPFSIDSGSLIRFEYNATGVKKTISLNQPYIDVKGKTYTGSISEAPYSSIVLIKQVAQDSTASAGACPGTGTIVREEWDNIPGNDVANIPLQTLPGSSIQLTSLETTAIGDNYGARIRGYLCPPQSGVYTFFISGDDAAELWVSTNDNPANKIKIAYLLSWTNFHEWNKFPSQTSGIINLQAGHKYYIEVLHKQGGGDNHVSVAWKLPNGATEAPIAGKNLLPYTSTAPPVPSSACAATGTILHEQWDNVAGNDVANIPVNAAPVTTNQLSVLETQNAGYNYGDRMRGYICPPKSGVYTFLLAADDAAELWLSTDNTPVNKVKVASLLSWTDYHQFNKFPSQTSADISLEAGHSYYIEVLHKQGGGGDNLTVGWNLPDGTTEIPVTGNHLSPYIVNSAAPNVNRVNQKTTGEAELLSGSKNSFTLYPDPVYSNFILKLDNAYTGIIKVVVINQAGRVQKEVRLIKNQKQFTQRISITDLPRGSYIIQVQMNNRMEAKKIIKL